MRHMRSAGSIECHHCRRRADVADARLVEVGSWLFLDCPVCRCQSDVTMQVGPSARPVTLLQPHRPLATARVS